MSCELLLTAAPAPNALEMAAGVEYFRIYISLVLHLTGLSRCSMCFILLDCLTALCASSYWTVSLLYVLHLTGLSHCSMFYPCVCVCVCMCVCMCMCMCVRVCVSPMLCVSTCLVLPCYLTLGRS